MKKLKLNLAKIEGAELLTREQLKMVMGGSGGGSTNDNPCGGSTVLASHSGSCTSYTDPNDINGSSYITCPCTEYLCSNGTVVTYKSTPCKYFGNIA